MHLETTTELLRHKLSLIGGPRPARFDPFDLDALLVRLPLLYGDRWLDGPASAVAISALVEEGVPRWALRNRGNVRRILALLAARRERGLASVAEARLLQAQGHPCPWGVLSMDVEEELERTRELPNPLPEANTLTLYTHGNG
jgi:hypothetical protein